MNSEKNIKKSLSIDDNLAERDFDNKLNFNLPKPYQKSSLTRGITSVLSDITNNNYIGQSIVDTSLAHEQSSISLIDSSYSNDMTSNEKNAIAIDNTLKNNGSNIQTNFRYSTSAESSAEDNKESFSINLDQGSHFEALESSPNFHSKPLRDITNTCNTSVRYNGPSLKPHLSSCPPSHSNMKSTVNSIYRPLSSASATELKSSLNSDQSASNSFHQKRFSTAKLNLPNKSEKINDQSSDIFNYQQCDINKPLDSSLEITNDPVLSLNLNSYYQSDLFCNSLNATPKSVSINSDTESTTNPIFWTNYNNNPNIRSDSNLIHRLQNKQDNNTHYENGHTSFIGTSNFENLPNNQGNFQSNDNRPNPCSLSVYSNIINLDDQSIGNYDTLESNPMYSGFSVSDYDDELSHIQNYSSKSYQNQTNSNSHNRYNSDFTKTVTMSSTYINPSPNQSTYHEQHQNNNRILNNKQRLYHQNFYPYSFNDPSKVSQDFNEPRFSQNSNSGNRPKNNLIHQFKHQVMPFYGHNYRTKNLHLHPSLKNQQHNYHQIQMMHHPNNKMSIAKQSANVFNTMHRNQFCIQNLNNYDTSVIKKRFSFNLKQLTFLVSQRLCRFWTLTHEDIMSYIINCTRTAAMEANSYFEMSEKELLSLKRRTYDSINVMEAIGLLKREKTNKKFLNIVWIGYQDFPELEKDLQHEYKIVERENRILKEKLKILDEIIKMSELIKKMPSMRSKNYLNKLPNSIFAIPLQSILKFSRPCDKNGGRLEDSISRNSSNSDHNSISDKITSYTLSSENYLLIKGHLNIIHFILLLSTGVGKISEYVLDENDAKVFD